jgi:hypothetical protein
MAQAKTPVTNGSAAADTVTSTNAPADTIPWDDAVAEGKEIVARINARHEDTERDQFRLGEIADKVETKYNDGTQVRLATELGIVSSSLKRYCSVYRAWKGTNIGAPGPQSVSYSVLRELATHPKREEIVRANPNITKRQAQQEMTKLKDADEEKKKGAKGKREPEWVRDTRGWFNKQVVALNAVTDELNKAMEKWTLKQRNQFASLELTLLLEAYQKGERKAAELIDRVDAPLEEAANKLTGEGRVNNTPAPNLATEQSYSEA